jgi:hypothetical protein
MKFQDIQIGQSFCLAGEQDKARRITGTSYPWKKVEDFSPSRAPAGRIEYLGRNMGGMENGQVISWYDTENEMDVIHEIKR